jgi:hypothetical protein
MSMDPKLEAAHRKLADRVMGRPGISGIAVGERNGKPCLVVYLANRRAGADLPRTVGGFPVVGEFTGEIRPL